MPETWTDRLVGARMQVDQQFQDRLNQSRFSNQEWGLIMTSVEFEIRHAGDPDRAELVADTSALEQVLPELDNIQEHMGGAGAPGQGGSGGGSILGRLGGLLDGLTSNGSGGSDEDRKAAAEALVAEYAGELQTFLERNGRWDDIREQAAAEE